MGSQSSHKEPVSGPAGPGKYWLLAQRASQQKFAGQEMKLQLRGYYIHSGIPTNLLLIKYCNLKWILLYIQYSNYRMGCGWCGRRVVWWRGVSDIEVLCVKVVMASYGNISRWNPSLMMFKEGDPFYPPFSIFGEVIFFNFDKLLREV